MLGAYLFSIFISAFLLFLVQPIIARVILPWFGGSASVWTTCLLFFQTVLVLGYLYVHRLVSRLPRKRQAAVHLALLVTGILALFPMNQLTARGPWMVGGLADPTVEVLGLLTRTVGLPYFILSATSPLLQSWYAGTKAPGSPRMCPYRLYALSNSGSLLALLSYPVVVEPLLSLRHQVALWSVAFFAAAIAMAIIALRSAPSQPQPGNRLHQLEGPAPDWKLKTLWVALAACASTLLLAITNHVSQNVAAIPFLWILPLSLYLLSLVLCFERGGWYRRGLFLRLLGLALGGMIYALYPAYLNAKLTTLIPLFCAGLFVCCMVCHGELARLKPPAQYLTSYYLMVAVGGSLGGIFVGLLAPRIFAGYWELLCGLGACAILTLIVLHRDPSSPFYRARWRPGWLLLVVLCAALGVSLMNVMGAQRGGARVMVRNFYGVLRVIDLGRFPGRDDPTVIKVLQRPRRKLMNGTIDHGIQLLLPDQRRLPTTYYGPTSGIGLAIREAAARGPVRVGVIGLGAGTLAAYGRPGDQYTFYEINPLVVRLAESEFTFLRDSPAHITVVVGDGRLSLAAEPPQGFDVLAVDAFSGDSIPVHLLTQEALALYFRHLKPGGVVAFNVSNRYVHLAPVVAAVARSLGKPAGIVDSDEDTATDLSPARWVLVTDRSDFFETQLLKGRATLPKNERTTRVWTDDYSNLLAALK
jgi:SAM-dependent methyltransferase